MVIYGLLFFCRESLVRAFRKKTPLSVRRPGGGGLRGGRKGSIETELFLYDDFPNRVNILAYLVVLNLDFHTQSQHSW